MALMKASIMVGGYKYASGQSFCCFIQPMSSVPNRLHFLSMPTHNTYADNVPDIEKRFLVK